MRVLMNFIVVIWKGLIRLYPIYDIFLKLFEIFFMFP